MKFKIYLIIIAKNTFLMRHEEKKIKKHKDEWYM